MEINIDSRKFTSIEAIEEADRRTDIMMGFINRNLKVYKNLSFQERIEVDNIIIRNSDYPDIQNMTVDEVRKTFSETR